MSGSTTIMRKYLKSFVGYKGKSGIIEPCTVKSYRGKARQMSR